MANTLRVPIVGDPSSLLKAFKRSEHAAAQFSREISKTGVSARQSAQAQVQAAVKTQSNLRRQITEYHKLASAAQRGSREQVAAAELAARAERRLAQSIGTSTKEARQFQRVAGRRTPFHLAGGRQLRGGIAASGVLGGAGRALAFGSAGFLAGFSATAGIKAIINQASILQEETEKTGVLFGRSEKQVQRWSRTLASSFGISEEAALQSAGVFGNIFRSLHFGEAPAAKMSERLVQLAADMASFNNASPEETLKALQSGLAGQVRPLRAYGVFLSIARIKQEAVSSGLVKNASHLTAAQKVQAAYNIILRDTALQHGDVARNTGSLSVAQSKLRANLQDSEAIIGRALLPSLVQLANGLSRYLSRLNRTGQLQRSVNQSVRVARSVFAGVRAVIVPAAHALVRLSHALGGAKSTAKLFASVFIGMKILKWAGEFRVLAASIRGVAAAEALAGLGGGVGGMGFGRRVAGGGGGIGLPGGVVGGAVVGAAWAFAQKGEVGTKPQGAQKISVGPGQTISYLDPITGKYVLVGGFKGGNPDAFVAKDMAKRHPELKRGAVTGEGVSHRRSGARGAPMPIPGGAGGGGGKDAGPRRASLSFQISLAQEQLAKDELTATTKDNRATLSRLAALTRQKIAKTKDLQTRTQLYQELGGYESQIASLDKDAADKRKQHTQAEKKARVDQVKALKEREQTLKGRIKEITSSFKDAVDTARQGIGDLFSGPVLNPVEDVNKGILGVTGRGGATSVKTLTADLNAQVTQAAAVQRDLARLKRRGAPSQLLKELRAQGVAGAPQIHALATASPKALAAFEKAFGRREHLAIRTARTTMRAQLVTLRATRLQLNLTRAQQAQLRGGTTVVHTTVNLDGKKVAENTTVHQQRRNRSTATQRRGPSAGRTHG